MRNGIKFITSFLTALLFAVGIGSAFGATAGVGTFVASTLIKMPAGSLGMAVTPEIWTDFISGTSSRTTSSFWSPSTSRNMCLWARWSMCRKPARLQA